MKKKSALQSGDFFCISFSLSINMWKLTEFTAMRYKKRYACGIIPLTSQTDTPQ